MNTRKQGDIGVAQAIYYFTNLGYTVSVPMSESSRYDLIVDTGEQLLRVQCKRSESAAPSGSPSVALRTCGGNQSWNHVAKKLSASEIDYLWASYGSRGWLIPISEVEGKSSVTLGPSKDEFLVFGSDGSGLSASL